MRYAAPLTKVRATHPEAAERARAMDPLEEHTLRTGDGWSLRLAHLAPSSPSPTPVLLLHGFGANGFCLLNERPSSLGRYLAARGFDIWLLEFRGTHSSHHPERNKRLACISVDDKIRLVGR